ncbi:MAG TPA: PTS sugar transporter subunit IIA [Casimicrobiaceae bacterium]|jgi:PTS system nitrogen regulatory IIA component
MNIISRILSSDDVVVGLDVSNKLRALEEAAVILERRHKVSHAPVLRALWRREQVGSTGLGHGIAVPHARITGISEPIVLFVRTKSAIEFHAPDREPVSLLFVILVPEHANDEHLKILATVSEMFSNKTFRDRLEATMEPAAIQHLFSEWKSDDLQHQNK